LTSLNVNFDEEVRALLILCSLFESWNSLVMAISNFVSGSNTLKFDDVVSVILSEEIRRKCSGSTSTLGSVLNVESKGRSKERGNHYEDHGNSWGKSKDKRSQSKENKDCWYHGKLGHLKKDFWSWKIKEGYKQKGNKEKNVVINKSNEDALIISLDNVDDS
jgi:hypothetical protein